MPCCSNYSALRAVRLLAADLKIIANIAILKLCVNNGGRGVEKLKELKELRS
jgi:hypothetical protein